MVRVIQFFGTLVEVMHASSSVVALQFDNLNSLFLRVKFYNRVVFVTVKRKIYG